MAKNDNFIFGIHAVLEAVNAGKDLDKVLVRRGAGSDLLKKLLGVLGKMEIPVQQVPVEKLNRITGKNHQGVIAFLSEITYVDITTLLPTIFEKGEDPLILLLDGISDVRNFGAIARSAECAGVHAIVIPASGSAAINADAIKTSAGALHRISVCRHRDLLTVMRFLKESGLRMFAATEKASESMYATDITGPAGLIMGSEDTGISPQLLKIADSWLSIPMKGTIASLNVSVAAGVILFELLRQREAASQNS
ncbi:MAG: 23S rRNA (guanosine(2251)-2'-O)-methyltransferase RlmB [Bacteroidota bacterium]|nr:23S rRNA (guanosine(2251)-2'-O)-methyltransferase RlmB [Bacteroidota bacterium]